MKTRILRIELKYCLGAKVLAMELKILVLEPKILASEPEILAIGATITGHWSLKY